MIEKIPDDSSSYLAGVGGRVVVYGAIGLGAVMVRLRDIMVHHNQWAIVRQTAGRHSAGF